MKKDLVKVFKNLVCVSLFSVLMFQCNKETTPAGPDLTETARQDSIAKAKKDSLIQDSIEKNRITYRTIIFPKKKKDSAMKAFNEEFDKDQQRIILALNRLDMDNKWRADTLSVPDKFDETLMRYSPFPAHIAKLDKVDKIAFFSYPIQAYALYEHGKLVKWGPTSMGKKTLRPSADSCLPIGKKNSLFQRWTATGNCLITLISIIRWALAGMNMTFPATRLRIPACACCMMMQNICTTGQTPGFSIKAVLLSRQTGRRLLSLVIMGGDRKSLGSTWKMSRKAIGLLPMNWTVLSANI